MWKLLVQLRENMLGQTRDVATTLLPGEMTFTPNLMLDEGLYAEDGGEAFLYEDQFMLDLPW